MIEVTNEVRILETNGRETLTENKTLLVMSHLKRRNYVVLCIEGQNYTVRADDLVNAAENSRNTGVL